MASIVIYDSGVGGLSIYQEVVAACPEHDLLFISDNQAFPYGTKSESELVSRVMAVAERLNEHYAPDVLIVACNTASTLVLSSLRERFEFDVVGVVPAIKPAAQASASKHIGLLATPATVARRYTDELIQDFASDCKVTRVGSEELVRIAEDKLHGRELDKNEIITILKPIIDATKLDTLVLACTHFPLLNDELAAIFKESNRDIKLIDSGEAIARRVRGLVEPLTDLTPSTVLRTAVFTQSLQEPSLFKRLEQLGFNQIELLDV